MVVHLIRRPGVIVATLVTTILLLLCGGVGQAFARFNEAAHYPGATHLGDQTLVKYTPSLAFKRTGSYRSSDPFPKVYNWYSARFALGPESHAQSNCILMTRSSTSLWLIEEQVSVTVCSTPGGQMMFVMRSLIIPYMRW